MCGSLMKRVQVLGAISHPFKFSSESISLMIISISFHTEYEHVFGTFAKRMVVGTGLLYV